VGKISNALNKYAKERKDVDGRKLPPIALNKDDVNALLRHDRETRHLLRYDKSTGEVDHNSIEVLRNQGTIQRLLDCKLIYPSGKLTSRGINECKRLEAELGYRPIIRPTALDPGHTSGAEDLEPLLEEKADGAGTAMTSEHRDSAGELPVELQPVPVPGPASDETQNELEEIQQEDLSPPVEIEEEEQPVRPVVNKVRAPVQSVHYNDKAIDPNLISLLTPHSFEAEQFKILRTNILFPVAGKPPRSILVTSAGPGEGKTFAAANLAISIALNINKYVLLVDGDLRKPEQHKRFGFGKLPGLTDYLTNGTPLQSLLVKTKIEKLTLLPAGEPPENPSELVSSEAMANLIEEVSNRYRDRIIVIDSPPPRLAAETGVLARQVDGILVVVSYGKTRREDAQDLIEAVGKEKVLGSLINYIDLKATRHYGYSQYGYYGKKTSNQ
jgi:exopolysaccharide/PEP-CTERM locus tyrosine autokinase